MTETNEPRALAAALSGPVFTPRGHAMLAAERHVDRWAPETNTNRVRPLRNLGFADRLVSPWMETAQRSVSQLQRLFGPFAGDDGGAGGQPDQASWLFPRPSFQDELDWMAAARQPQRDAQQSPLGLPVSLHDYIAPSLAKSSRSPFGRLAAFEGVLGPRLVMPVGLGGLIAMVNHNLAMAGASRRGGFASPELRVPTLQALIPAMTLVATVAHQFGKPRPKTSAFAAVQDAAPAALSHVAWSDRWLARFSGARDSSLDAAAPKPFTVPELVLMAPQFDATARPVVKRMVQAPAPTIRRYDDDEPTPDDVFTEVAAAAARVHASSHGRPVARPAAPMVRRDSVADAIAHAVPAAPDAGVSAQLASSPFAPAFRHILPLAAAPVFDVRSIDSSGLSVAYLAGVLAPSTGLVVAGAALGDSGRMIPREGLDWSPTFVATAAATPRAQESTEPVTARSALLVPERPVIAARRRTVADAMVSAMALPLLGESLDESPGTVDVSGVHQRVAAFAAPGMVADRAHAWSVAQERSTSDLAYDFVPPELVLAARVYGLGPAEASQAMRLATAGPGELVAMAGTVDRTFVQVLQIEAERRDQTRRAESRPAQTTSAAPVEYASDDTGDAPAAPPASTAAFGVDRRQPRGSFMWPAAAVAALGMTAAPPEGDALMPVAALELLAASAVAQLGTYAVLGGGRSLRRPELSISTSDAIGRSAEAKDMAADLSSETFTQAKQRAAFEALYVAMEKSRDPQSSLAADAARAVAFAGRGDSTFSAEERAQAAWSVLPLVALRPGGADGRSTLPRFADSTVSSGGRPGAGATDVAADRMPFGMPVVSGPTQSAAWTGDMALYAPPAGFVESRPGMAQLSARAGEALSSYVTPVVVSSQTEDAEARAAAAAAEIMRPGRSAGRFGGGETEIPTWFEAAARKLLADRGGADGLSLAELTLVNAAPAQQVAAAKDETTTQATTQAEPAAKPEFTRADVEDIATRVLRIVREMIDAAKTRGGMYV